MPLRVRNLWEGLRSSYWFVPILMASFAIALSLGMAQVDETLGANYANRIGWIYSGGPEGARGVLSTIAGSVIGVAGTTFSILIAVLSLTSGQFGPRLLRSFMRDTANQVVLGTFTSTFLYCLLVLRTVRGTDRTTYVPHLSVTVGVMLAILSVGVLIFFVHHVAESIQVSHLIAEVGKDADRTVVRLFPEGDGESESGWSLPVGVPVKVAAKESGYLESIDVDALLRMAERHDLVLRIEVRPGEYVLPAMTLLSAWPDIDVQTKPLVRAFNCGRYRTTLQDPEFAFLQMAEIAVRALSPDINDPFTAMECLDRITASMCLVATRPWPSFLRADDLGAVRLLAKAYEPDDLVRAAFGHIRDAAGSSPAVLDKLRSSLETLVERTVDPRLGAALRRERSRF